MARAARERRHLRRPRSRTRELLRVVSVALTASSLTLAHTGVDPDLVQRATVGPPAAMAATSAAAVTRARRAPFEFSPNMQVLWRARVTGPVTLEPVVDHLGSVALLHERGSLSMLSDTGAIRWSLRLGDATPGVSPALLSDGNLAIYNFDDRLLRIDREGNLVGSTQLGLKGKPSALLPLERGGVAVAVDEHLVHVDHRGAIIAESATIGGDGVLRVRAAHLRPGQPRAAARPALRIERARFLGLRPACSSPRQADLPDCQLQEISATL